MQSSKIRKFQWNFTQILYDLCMKFYAFTAKCKKKKKKNFDFIKLTVKKHLQMNSFVVNASDDLFQSP